ncbi:MAG: flavodoxin-dependent (E)-4-hydroxy-3-methylbut-2-enyl-diphosphate synthase [Planctomycetes bacterium]|nr:flavodoxin-dependent (E)-4-hydroxy-3-methylbut-2-enyl-diphosphate synthase [Planctomycetota bacterium]
MVVERRRSRQVRVGTVPIGGGAPVSVQTMTRSPAGAVAESAAEVAAAAAAGCDLVRLAVPSVAAAAAFGRIAARSPLPLVADTHFDWRTTLAAIREGAAKVRINPGNMDPDGLRRVVDAAGERGIPVRIGGNSGSIQHRRPMAPDQPLADLMAEEILAWARRMEDMGFRDIVLSVKTPDATGTVRANRLLAERSDYPLHLGVTAAGVREDSLLKSAAAIGSLLLDGIGDTIRFSFTGDMAGEVAAGRDLLRALELRRDGPEIIACPACGRCRVALPDLAREVQHRLRHLTAPLRVAVMGCEVNGPGEARAADVGIASAGGVMHLFVRGEVVERVPADQAVDRLVAEAERLAAAAAGSGDDAAEDGTSAGG